MALRRRERTLAVVYVQKVAGPHLLALPKVFHNALVLGGNLTNLSQETLSVVVRKVTIPCGYVDSLVTATAAALCSTEIATDACDYQERQKQRQERQYQNNQP